MKLYHNPKCSKSRTAKKILDEACVDYQIHLYLNEPLSELELFELLEKLDLNITDIIRTKEAVWKDNFKGNKYTNDELIKIVSENIKLLERPIIEHKNKAVVARTDETIAQIISFYNS